MSCFNYKSTVSKQVANEWSGTQNFDATTLVDGAEINWDLENNQVSFITLGGNRTLKNPTNMKAGATYILVIYQDGTGGRTLAYESAYDFPASTPPILSTAINAIDVITFVCDGTRMLGVAQKAFG